MIVYQIFTRLFGNRNTTRKEWGTIAENGCGKMNGFDATVLKRIKSLGVTHVWYTGILRHATQTDYNAYGIPSQHAEVVKGCAGSPYAITDYYDVDPDLAEDVAHRMQEWEALIARTHAAGMKVIMDFVPNHVAREYRSVCKPAGVKDLGEDDDTAMAFSANNNFYYCWGCPLDLSQIAPKAVYEECPARATGNDRFDNCPSVNDWYETVKLNYGIDYCDAGGRSEHFDPMPDTWRKMTDILLFWAAKGVDGFRCDMAEMVPPAFWSYATSEVKRAFPDVIFIGEVYEPRQYRTYIASGYDFLYDKVGMYDCLRAVVCGNRCASDITSQWQQTDDIRGHMLYFLENHDEQRIASDFFAGDAKKGIPAHIVSCLLNNNPYMLYAGQELGERGMEKEGFSGRDGRTTIFDYWSLDSVQHGYFDLRRRTASEKTLFAAYQQVMHVAETEKAAKEGRTFDLMYVNPHLAEKQFAFIREVSGELLFVVANFSDEEVNCKVRIPAHAFDYLSLNEQELEGVELLHGGRQSFSLKRDGDLVLKVPANGGVVYKLKPNTAMEEYILNDHNKEEFPPAHTAEHLLNQLMVRMFGCERSTNAHIERKKSKISYILDHKPNRKEEKAIEEEMNRLIAEDMPVTFEYVDRDHLPAGVSLDRLPSDASETVRIVRIGDYDVCPCIGKHVRSTSQIGRFEMLGTNWDETAHSFRIRFKIVQ
ncbi:MAG: alpha-amylase family glycosyl hydrolase [Prevotella sp.]